MVDEDLITLFSGEPEPILQTDWEQEHESAHVIFSPSTEEIRQMPEFRRLDNAAVEEHPNQPFRIDPRSRGIPVKSDIAMRYYERVVQIVTINEPGSDFGKKSKTIEHRLVSLASEGCPIGITIEEAEQYIERAVKERHLDRGKIIIGPAYELVTINGIKVPRRIPRQLMAYYDHYSRVSDDTEAEFRPWTGRRVHSPHQE